MTERWTDKKRGGDVTGFAPAISFQRNQREVLGGLPQTFVQMDTPDGLVSARGFGKYERVMVDRKPAVVSKYSPVLVYVGPTSNPFSEYAVKDMFRQTSHYWNVLPDASLTDLKDKKLVILPCPVRALTVSELSALQRIMVGVRRIVVFCGSDVSVASTVLSQLGSRLEFVAYPSFSGIYNLAGYITPKQLAWWPGEAKAYVAVRQAYWSTAACMDWNGFGLQYANVTTCHPFACLKWSATTPASIISWVGDYQHSMDLVLKIAAYDPPPGGSDPTWTVTWVDNSTYPSGYLPADYSSPSISLDSWGEWMDANYSQMPMCFTRPAGYVHSRTAFSGGYYNNYSDLVYREWFGSLMSYFTGERVIACAYKPTWLTWSYSPEVTDAAFATSALSLWFLNADMLYYDLFNSGGFQPIPPALSTHTRNGVSGSGDVTQF